MDPLVYPGIHRSRVHALNDRVDAPGRFVLYWMQQSQRAEVNHALEYALREANRLGQGVLVAFGLADDYPEANLRHYAFMLAGLKETAQALRRRGIALVARIGSPPRVALELGRDAALIVCDRGYLRHQRAWRAEVAAQAACRVVEVESDAVVPIEAVSAKAEVGARTLRPKLQRRLPDYLVALPLTPVRTPSAGMAVAGLDLDEPEAVLKRLKIDRSVAAVPAVFKGGTGAAKTRLQRFLADGLARYDRNHNQPQTDDVSRLSPYLHFGQIAPLFVALEARGADAPAAARDAFLEQVVVRRELACNFVHFTPGYDSYACIPAWAQKSLAEHARDRRPGAYTAQRIENAETGDPYWNAAMAEMRCTGFMHSHMRMYWGKKILEWSRTPAEGFALTLRLNNRYFLDGRDPNSYSGVGWLYGVHDRPWPERPVYGKVRSMTAGGLERKCDIRAYAENVRRVCGQPARYPGVAKRRLDP
jgi:deoxyribodipyrimidine photo-lyase